MSESGSKVSQFKSRMKSLGKKRKVASGEEECCVKDTVDTMSAENQLLPVHQQDVGPTAQSTNPSTSMPPLRGAPGEATRGDTTRMGTMRRTKRPRVSGLQDQEKTLAAAVLSREPAVRSDQPSQGVARADQSSYWARARDSFEEKNGKRIVELMKMGEDRADAAPELQRLLDERKRSNKGVSPTVERAIRNILVYKDISVAAATFDPTRAAPTIVRGICTILQFLINDSDLQREMMDEVDEVTIAIRHWGNIEYLYMRKSNDSPRNRYQSVEDNLVDLYKSILAFKVCLSSICDQGTSAQILKATGTIETLKKLYRSFKVCESNCTKTFDDCQKINDEHTKIRDWISDIQSENAYMAMYERIELDKYPGCGQWVVDLPEYQNWSAGRSDILWIQGTVGTGKSSLMTRVVKQHRETSSIHSDRRLAYFYCTKDSGDQSSKTVLKAILRQVVYNPVNCSIVQKARNMYNEPERPSFESLRQCEDLFVGVLEAGVKVRIVIDALDELDEWRALLNVLRKIYNKAPTPNQFQLFVSGRAEVNVEAKFEMAVKIDINHIRTEAEMREYITRSINTCPKDERPVEGACPELEQRLTETLCKKANGMFQWVKLQLTFFLCATPRIVFDTSFEQQLDALDKQPLANAKELYNIYDTILNANSREGSNERVMTTFIFQWMICKSGLADLRCVLQALFAAKPILVGGSERSPITLSQILCLLQNLVYLSRNCLIFAHASIPEYLQQNRPNDYARKTCHANMARTCIKFLMDPYQGTVSPIQERSKNLEYWRKRSFTHHPQWSWTWYAFNHFAEHCKALSVEERESHGIKSLLVKWIVDEDSPMPFSSWRNTWTRKGDEVVKGLQFVLREDLVDVAEVILSSSKHRKCCLSPASLYKCGKDVDFGIGDRRKILPLFSKTIIELHPHDESLITGTLLTVLISGHEQATRHLLRMSQDDIRNELIQRVLRRNFQMFTKQQHGWDRYLEKHEVVERLTEMVLELYRDNEELLFLAIVSAAAVENEQAVRQLLAAGVDFLRDERGVESPLLIAVREKNTVIVKLLLEASTEQGQGFKHEVMQECLKTVQMQKKQNARRHVHLSLSIPTRVRIRTDGMHMEIHESSSIKEERFYRMIENAFADTLHKYAPIEDLLRRHGANPALVEDTDTSAVLRAAWDEVPESLRTAYVQAFLESSTKQPAVAQQALLTETSQVLDG